MVSFRYLYTQLRSQNEKFIYKFIQKKYKHVFRDDYPGFVSAIFTVTGVLEEFFEYDLLQVIQTFREYGKIREVVLKYYFWYISSQKCKSHLNLKFKERMVSVKTSDVYTCNV